MAAPIHYWMQPTAAACAAFAAAMRDSNGARALAIGWVVVAAALAWFTATGAHAGQPWFVRVLLLPFGLYFLFGTIYALSLVMPTSQVRLEPDAIRDVFGKQQTVHALADIAGYRLADLPAWRRLTLVKTDGSTPGLDVPQNIAADVIHRYFAERGIPEQ